MTAIDRLKQIQQSLAEQDLYHGPIDASWGEGSKDAFQTLLDNVDLEQVAKDETASPPVSILTQSDRTNRNIDTLHAKVRPLAQALVTKAAANGISIVVTSGTRTYEEQNALFEQGRTKAGQIVTNARGGHSNHNFGIAFDVTIFSGSQPVFESPKYKILGALGKSLGLQWGGDWTTINDEPHFELHPDWAAGLSEATMLAELRDRHAKGIDVFA